MNRAQTSILVISAAILALVGVAVGASYFTKQSMVESRAVEAPAKTDAAAEAAPKKRRMHARNGQTRTRYSQANQQGTMQQLPACDDKNIVGTVAGGVAGGLVGNQFGKGTGKTVATLGGVAGGAYLGNEYIPTRGVTCR